MTDDYDLHTDGDVAAAVEEGIAKSIRYGGAVITLHHPAPSQAMVVLRDLSTRFVEEGYLGLQDGKLWRLAVNRPSLPYARRL